MNRSTGPGWRLRALLALIAALALQGGIVALTSSPASAAGTVTVSIQGRGNVTADGIDCTESGTPDCSQFYPNTTETVCDPENPPCYTQSYPPEVELAAANRNGTGYTFSHWEGCTSVSGQTCALTVTSARTVTPHFVDSAAPTVTGLSPGSGTHAGTIAMSAQATDNTGITKVEFRVRNALVATDTSAPYGIDFNTSTVADGGRSSRQRPSTRPGTQPPTASSSTSTTPRRA